MASATTKISVTCPECAKLLRLSTRPTAGKKIKCPACGEVFVPEFDDDEGDAAAIQEKPTLKAAVKSPSKSNPDDGPRGKKMRDDGEDAPPKKRRRDEDEDEDEEDARPRKKKKGKQKSGSMMMVILLVLGGGGLFFGVGVFALAAFVWPGFLLSPQKAAVNTPMAVMEGDKAPPPENKAPVVVAPSVKSYVLANAPILLGSNVKSLRDSNQLEPLLRQIDALTGNDKMPDEFRELVRNSDVAMISIIPPAQLGLPFMPPGPPQPGGFKQPKGFKQPGIPPRPGLQKPPPFQPGPGGNLQKPQILLAVHVSSAEALAKFKNLPKMGREEKLAGKYSVYRPGKNDPDWPPMVAIGGDRTLLICELDDNDLISVLDRGAKNEAPQTDVMNLLPAVEASHFWAAWHFDDKTRQQFQGLDTLTQKVPQLQGMSQAMQRAKGGSLSVNSVNGSAWKLQVNVHCANDTDAANVKKGGQTLVDSMIVGLTAMAGGGQGQAKLPASVTNDIGTIAFQSQGDVASVTMSISNQSIDDLKNSGGKGVPKGNGPPTGVPPVGGPGKIRPKVGGTPKGGAPATPTSISLDRMFSGKTHEAIVNLQGGKSVTITARTTPVKTNVNLHVLQGSTGEKELKSDLKGGGNASVTFVVPATGAYRIRVFNRGPGIAESCLVTIRED